MKISKNLAERIGEDLSVTIKAIEEDSFINAIETLELMEVYIINTHIKERIHFIAECVRARFLRLARFEILSLLEEIEMTNVLPF